MAFKEGGYLVTETLTPYFKCLETTNLDSCGAKTHSIFGSASAALESTRS
jgi:hypothetical protein